MIRRTFGCAILVALALVAILFLTTCRAREQSQPLPPTPTRTPPPVGQSPPAPINCTWRQADTRTISIAWQFQGAADGFRVYQAKTSLEATLPLTARAWTIADLPPNVQHHFDVRAYNASGESRADACSVDVTRR